MGNPFELIYAKTCDNNAFVKYNIKPVVEDYFKTYGNIFCIADGVTRDSINGEPIPYPTTEEECKKILEIYPNPSGAFESARICADNFIKYIQQIFHKSVNEKDILEIAKKINTDIKKINEGREIDYLANDYFGCVAVGGYIDEKEDTLYCFSIGDCHIMCLDEEGNIIFQTNNNHKQFEDYLENIYIPKNNYDWNKSEDRVMVRRDYRNNPDVKYNGKDISFGVLTGEKNAEYYIEEYQVSLKDVKYICAYSDGCEPFFKEKEQRKKICLNPTIIEEQGKERTLIIYEKK